MFNQIGVTELLIVLGIVLIIFGPKRLPGIGRQLGQGMREFKESITSSHDKDDDDEDAKPAIAGRPPAEPAEHTSAQTVTQDRAAAEAATGSGTGEARG